MDCAVRRSAQGVEVIYTYAATGLAGLAIGFGMAWNVQGWRMGDEIADLRANHAEAARAAESSARARESAATVTLATIEQKASDEKKRLSADLAAAHRELRNRPERPSGGDVSKGPAVGVGCTGAQLYRSDVEFLLGEAARADGLRIALGRCQAAYDQAVKLTSP
jgi:hypothetical protein